MTRFLKKLQSIAPFLSIIGLSIVHALLLNPWVFASEMWAEMATNYYAFSESHSWAIKILSLDSGYYPLPMRAISLGVSLFNVPSQTIPLVYNLIAVVLTGSIVGLFTLPIFRHVVQSDWLRWLASVVILIICDWETRTFINFPYFGIWICGMLIAVSLLKKTDAPPRWGWVFPVLMMSKPHYLVLMPATVIAAIKTKAKWRWLMISSVALQVIQCVVIAISARNGVMRPATEATPFLVKIKALFWHSFGYIGAFGLGPRWQGISPVALVIIGLIITGGSLGVMLYSKRASFASKTMIGIGLSIVILTFAMNTIMLSHQWPINATQFTRIELYRHTIPAFYGFLMMALGVLICTRLASKKIIFGIVLIWGITTGWIDRGLIISKPPSHPTLGSSQWQLMAQNISRYDTIGIPVDPYGWAYLKNCQLIGDSKKGAILIQNADEIPAKTDFSLPMSPSINAAILVGFGLSVTPASPNIPVILTAEIRDQAGITRREVITRRIPSSGGLLYFGLEANHIVHPVEIRMTANQPIRIWTNEHNQPEILWIGQP